MNMDVWSWIFRPNATVVHRGLTEETIDDRLVIARFPDEPRPVGYDRRELKRLIMIPALSRGPVIMSPRDLWSILRSCFVRTVKP
jgi:hypothetical protein